MPRPCVFLDRDGTLNEDPGYVHRTEDCVLFEGTREGLRQLKAAGYLLIVVTNQAGVARGLYPESAVHAFHEKLNAELGEDAAIDAFYYCPYHPDATVPEYRRSSELRKPGIGMLELACRDHPIALEASYLIGDRLIDIECARRAQVRPLLVRTGHGRAEEQRHLGPRDFEVSDDLRHASALILRAQSNRP